MVEVFEFYGWDWDFRIPDFRSRADFEKVLEEFDAIDEKSDAFRYPLALNGAASVPFGLRVNLFHFCSVLDPLFPVLDTLAVMFHEIVHTGPLSDAIGGPTPTHAQGGPGMDIHKNARTTPLCRESMVKEVLEHGRSLRRVGARYRVSAHTVGKWVRRYREEGRAGLVDRSCRPRRSPRAATGERVRRIVALRRRRLTCRHIAHLCGVSPATVARVLRSAGLNRLSALEPREPPRRYERERPGELIHLDIKKLGRFRRPGHRVTGNRRLGSPGAGWEYLHVCVDDASRVAFAEVFPDERKESAVAFLRHAVEAWNRMGIAVQQVITDNGSAYLSKAFRQVCAGLGLRHLTTRPYRPQTNGKAERFIQTAMREWAYAQVYRDAGQRTRELSQWIHHYNWHRPHSAKNHTPPMHNIGLTVNNLLTAHR
jgi:transposase InsO family protein